MVLIEPSIVIVWPPCRGGVARMVATSRVAVGAPDRRRICRYVGGSTVAGLDKRADGRIERHVVSICQIEVFAFLVIGVAAECRRS